MVRLASWSTSRQGPESSPRPQIRLNLWVSSSALRGARHCRMWSAPCGAQLIRGSSYEKGVGPNSGRPPRVITIVGALRVAPETEC